MKQKEQEYAKHSENKIINEKNTRNLSDEISKLEQNFRDVKLKWSQRNCYLAEIEDKNMEEMTEFELSELLQKCTENLNL